MMKQLLLSLLAILMPMVASADAVEIDGIYYNLISKIKEAEVTRNPNKYSGSVDIPASITFDGVEYSVTSIGESAFYRCSSLTSVTIPNSVTSIGKDAFWDCSSLTSVNISDIAAWCSITFPNSYSNPLRNGGKLYLNGQLIDNLIIPNSVTLIGYAAFIGCSSLTSVTIPNSVTSIGGHAFCICSSLTSVTIPNSVTSIGESVFEGCSSLTSVTIPNNVTSIENSTFNRCSSLTSVTIPNSVTSIGEFVFEDCSRLTSVTIPNSVTSIGKFAFNRCSSLTSITIPNSVISIGENAFYGCSSLTYVTIPSSVTSIKKNTFSGCSSLTSVTIPNSVTSIGSYAFASCPELTDVYCLAEKVPSTVSDAFKGSYIEYATLHVPGTSIEAYRAIEPWKNFKSIVAHDGSVTPETPKCATPTISYRNGELTYNCETEGVEFVSTINDTDIKTHYDATIRLSATYVISVYAMKSGYEDSDVATATLCWIDQRPETEGITDGLAHIPARPVLISTDRGWITVTGLDDNTSIRIFTTDGQPVGEAYSHHNTAAIATHLQQGSIAIVQIGDMKSIKVIMR